MIITIPNKPADLALEIAYKKVSILAEEGRNQVTNGDQCQTK